MANRTDWAVNVDKLRVCFTMPENLYSYLNEHYTRYDELTNARILDEDDFSLVFIEDDETKMSAVLNVRDVDGYFRLAMFLDSVDRLIYFRNKKTREKISLVELASGI